VSPEDYPTAKGLEHAVQQVRSEIVRAAESFLGLPYRWGGASSEDGFHCSGLTIAVYQVNGLDLPRFSRAQWGTSVPVNRHELLIRWRFGAWDFYLKNLEEQTNRFGSLLPLCPTLILLLQFDQKAGQALSLGRREVIFATEVQIIAQPLLVKAVTPLGIAFFRRQFSNSAANCVGIGSMAERPNCFSTNLICVIAGKCLLHWEIEQKRVVKFF